MNIASACSGAKHITPLKSIKPETGVRTKISQVFASYMFLVFFASLEYYLSVLYGGAVKEDNEHINFIGFFYAY